MFRRRPALQSDGLAAAIGMTFTRLLRIGAVKVDLKQLPGHGYRRYFDLPLTDCSAGRGDGQPAACHGGAGAGRARGRRRAGRQTINARCAPTGFLVRTFCAVSKLPENAPAHREKRRIYAPRTRRFRNASPSNRCAVWCALAVSLRRSVQGVSIASAAAIRPRATSPEDV